MNPGIQWSRLRRALASTGGHRRAVALVLAMTLLVAAINASEPLLLKLIVDGLTAGGMLMPVVYGGAGLMGLVLLREASTFVSAWMSWRIRIAVRYQLLDASVQRLYSVPRDERLRDGVGATMTRLDRGIDGFVGAVSELVFGVLPAVFYLSFAIAVMLQLDWRMTLLVLAFTPLPALAAALAAPKQTRRERLLTESWARIYSRFNEVLSSLPTVRSFAMERREQRRFLTDVDAANRVVIAGVRFDLAVGASQNLAIAVARVATIALGGWLIFGGELTVGTLVAFLGYVGGVFGPVQGLTGVYRVAHNASVALDQVFGILDASDPVPDSPEAVEAPVFEGQVRFERLVFGYDRAEAPLLRDFDLRVGAGETVAFVGPSGAGKSTLMALLQRFADPWGGAIRIDGIDIRTLKQESVRRQIAVVLQDALLFNESIRDNIAYGRPGSSQGEIESAARAAGIHFDILRQPDGYGTVIGERGARLSGGQRQRIAIARALLKDAPILILDEATSALDPETEVHVQQAIERLRSGRTTFVIAHRLTTIVGADRIVVVKDGSILEQGRHCELMASHGWYAAMVERHTARLVSGGVRPIQGDGAPPPDAAWLEAQELAAPAAG